MKNMEEKYLRLLPIIQTHNSGNQYYTVTFHIYRMHILLWTVPYIPVWILPRIRYGLDTEKFESE